MAVTTTSASPGRRDRGTVVSDAVETPEAVAAARDRARADKDAEIWEATTSSHVHVLVRDRVDGGWKQVTVGGSGSRRLQLTVAERRFNQDLVPDESLGLDPFSNGMLVCVLGGAKMPAHLTDADIVALLGGDDEAAFAATVGQVTSEVLLRRMLSLAEAHASHSRFELLRDLVATRYKVGGRQPSVVEMAGGSV